MSQRNPPPPQPIVEVVSNEPSLVSDALAQAFQEPVLPTPAQLLAHRQGAAIAFRAKRAIFTITKTMEVHDHASSEATASLVLSRHIERGFAEGEQLAEVRNFFAARRGRIMHDTAAIADDAARDMRRLAADLPLPPTKLSWRERHRER